MPNLNNRAKCHPDRLHAAKGLCASCYAAQHHNANRDKRNAQARKRYHSLRTKQLMGLATPATCHPDRPLHAKGLCAPCYQTQYRRSRKHSQPPGAAVTLSARAVAVGLDSGKRVTAVQLRPVQRQALNEARKSTGMSAVSFFGKRGGK